MRYRARSVKKVRARRSRYGSRRTKYGIGRKRRAVRSSRRSYGIKRRRVARKIKSKFVGNVLHQQNYLNYRNGRKLSKRSYIDKTVLASSDKVVHQFKYYNNDASNTSGLTVDIGQWTSSATDRRYLPLYVFGIDIISQGLLGTVVNPYCRRAYMDTVTGSGLTDGLLKWVDVSSWNNSGGTTFGPTRIEDQSSVGSNITKALMKWVDMRFNFMGAKNRASKVEMKLMEIIDEEYDPWLSSTSDMSNYWAWYVSRYTCNSIHSVGKPPFRKPPFRELGSRVVELQPNPTFDGDNRGQEITMDWFWRCNRVVDYTKTQLLPTVTNDDAISNAPNYGQVAVGVTPSDRPARRQLMLVVGAFAPVVGVNLPSSLTDVSIEWNIRSCLNKLDRS